MRIAEPLTAEIRHRVGFAPDNVIEDPVPNVLKRITNTINVVVRTDHPNRTGVFKHTARCCQPVTGKLVIVTETVKLVPVIIDRINLGVVRTQKITAKLKIVGRVGEDQINGFLRQAVHHFDAVANQNLIKW